MGNLVNYVTSLHQSTSRKYIERMVDDKVKCMLKAKEYEFDYWDGDRRYGYGGYKYIPGHWVPVAKSLIARYGLTNQSRIYDIGCGKGYLLYEFTQVVPGVEVVGLDISEYGIQNSKEEVRPFLKVGNAVSLPFEDHTFDFVVSVTTFHNLYNYELQSAVREIQRVGKGNKKHIAVESYRNEREKANLLYWQLTCRSFYTPKEWEWVFDQCGYTGDYSYIVFE